MPLRRPFGPRADRSSRLTTAAHLAARSLEAFEPLEPRTMLALVSWVGTGDGLSWSDPANWRSGTLAVVPAANDDVLLLAPPRQLNLGSAAAARNVTITGNTALVGTLAVGDSLVWQGGGASSVTGSITGPAASFKLNLGALALAGELRAGGTNRISAPITLAADSTIQGQTDLDLPGSIDGPFALALSGSTGPGERLNLGPVGQRTSLTSLAVTGPADFRSVSAVGNVTFTGSASVAALATITSGAAATFGPLALAGQTLTVFARQIDLTGLVTGPGFLNLRPLTPDQSVSVADTPAPGDLDITQAELDLLDVGITAVEIGRLDGYAVLHIGNATVYPSTTFLMAGSSTTGARGPGPAADTTFGSIFIGAVSAGSTNTGVTVRGSEATTNLLGFIKTRGGPITINDAVRLIGDDALIDSTFDGQYTGGPVSIRFALNSQIDELNNLTINSGDSDVTLDGPVGNRPGGKLGQLIINGRGGINLNGPVVITENQQVYDGPVNIGGSITIVTNNAPVTFTQDVGGPGSLEIAPETGSTTFGGEVADFDLLIIDGGSSRSFAQSVSVNQLRVLGGRVDFDGGATVRSALLAGGTLSGLGTIQITAGLTWTGGTIDGSGELRLGPAAASSIEGTDPKTLARRLINAGYLAVRGQVKFADGSLTNTDSGLIEFFAAARFDGTGRLDNQASLRKSGPGRADIAGLAFSSSGSIEIADGILAAAPPDGPFAPAGSISLAAGAVLRVEGDADLSALAEFRVTLAGAYLNGVLVATGPVLTGGLLRVVVAPGYTPAIEDGFTIIISDRDAPPAAPFAAVEAPAFGARTLTQAAWNGALQVRFGGSIEFDGDGFLTLEDLDSFIALYYGSPDDRADFNRDGVINDTDLGDFIRAYYATTQPRRFASAGLDD